MAIWVCTGMADIQSLPEKNPDLQQQIPAIRTIKEHIAYLALYVGILLFSS